MRKYERLNSFLKSRFEEYVPMTFAEIEAVIGAKLPPSKRHRAWWSNNPDNNVMTREWLDAGYETESVDISGESLVFRRIRAAEPKPEGFGEEVQAEMGDSTRPLHPGIGFMKGLIKIEPGFDVTGPFTDERWDAGYLGEDRLAEGRPKEPRK
jgi:hypothetical protein